jgi:hypothetical protein
VLLEGGLHDRLQLPLVLTVFDPLPDETPGQEHDDDGQADPSPCRPPAGIPTRRREIHQTGRVRPRQLLQDAQTLIHLVKQTGTLGTLGHVVP